MNIEVVGADIKYAQIQAPTSRKSAPVPSAILHIEHIKAGRSDRSEAPKSPGAEHAKGRVWPQ